MNTINKINKYIAKKFLVTFLQVLSGFSLLIFFINFIDTLDKTKDSGSSLGISITMAFFQIPDSLGDVITSLVLISSIITFFLLSSKSEITIIRTSGYSLWQIVQPVAISAFFLGIFWITIFGPVSIQMIKKFNELEAKYIKNEMRELSAVTGDIWLKQTNIENPEEYIIIQAQKIYQDNLELNNVSVWFFNKDGQFYKKINTEQMFLTDNVWTLQNAVLNDANNINKTLNSYTISTDLKADFIVQKIVHNFQNVKLFSIFQLPTLIKNMQSYGFSSTKFRVYFQLLLNKPFLFVATTLIACFFGINHIRNSTTFLMIFLGIAFGIVLYTSSEVIAAFGSSGIIPIFASTWIITFTYIAMGILLIYHKESF